MRTRSLVAVLSVVALSGCPSGQRIDGPVPAPSCEPSDTNGTSVSLAPGGVRVLNDPTAMSCVRLAAVPAASTYLVVAAHANPIPDRVDNFTIAWTNSVVAPAPAVALAEADAMAAAAERLPEAEPQSVFESGLRELERVTLDPRESALQRPVARTSADVSAAIVTALSAVGDTVSIRVPDAAPNREPCTDFFNTRGVVKAIGRRVVIIQDVTAPAGFTPTDFAAIAAEFDTHTFPADSAYFGTPSDLDANTRVVIYYTPQVNRLTPRNSVGFVAGFFWAGDLFPQSACGQSNVGEILYLLAPDPTGIFSDPHSTATVRQSTRGTIAHELQHMIHAGVRLAANRPFESLWMSEGLAHLAEELVGRQQLGLGDTGNLRYADVSASQQDFNAFFFQNLARFRYWLQRPDTSAATSSRAGAHLAYRGAAWALLRYTIDQRAGGNVRGFTRSLVVGPDTNVANLVARAGVPFDTLMAGWMVTNYADDLGIAGLGAQFAYTSWNMRDAMAGITAGVYPLRTTPVGSGSSSQLTQSRSSSGTYYVASRSAGAPPTSVRFLSQTGARVSFVGARLYILRVN